VPDAAPRAGIKPPSRLPMTTSPPRQDFLKRHADKIGASGSLFAALCCLGFPAALSLLSAIGLGFLINDAVLLPALGLFLALTLYGLWSGFRRHGSRTPLILGSVGAVVLAASIWFNSLLAGLSLAVIVAATFLNVWFARKSPNGACTTPNLHS